MRRTARIDRSIDLLRLRSTPKVSTPYLCLACKCRISSFSTSTLSRKNVSFTEKLRQKIWGTENPPGLADPYGNRSRFDKTKRIAKEKEVEERNKRVEERSQHAEPDLSHYEPAITSEGLAVVGYETRDPGPQFRGFMEHEVKTDSDEITAVVHRAMVEIVALQLAGKPLNLISTSFPGHDITEEVQLVTSGGLLDLVYPDDSPFEKVLQSFIASVGETAKMETPAESEESVAADRSASEPLNPNGVSEVVNEAMDETAVKESPTESEEDVAADRSEVDPLKDTSPPRTYEELVATWDPAWLQISLEEPELKFAFVKRVMQLTGIRISDAHLNSTRSVEGLLKHLVKPTPPAKLVDALVEKEDLMTLPNVNVYARKISQRNKEVSVGRWKVIEQELRERGLDNIEPRRRGPEW